MGHFQTPRVAPGGPEGLEKPEEESLALGWPFHRAKTKLDWLQLLLLEWALDTHHPGDLV